MERDTITQHGITKMILVHKSCASFLYNGSSFSTSNASPFLTLLGGYCLNVNSVMSI